MGYTLLCWVSFTRYNICNIVDHTVSLLYRVLLCGCIIIHWPSLLMHICLLCMVLLWVFYWVSFSACMFTFLRGTLRSGIAWRGGGWGNFPNMLGEAPSAEEGSVPKHVGATKARDIAEHWDTWETEHMVPKNPEQWNVLSPGTARLSLFTSIWWTPCSLSFESQLWGHCFLGGFLTASAWLVLSSELL